jgi:hypothetical protein
MNRFGPMLVRLAIALALPTLACTGWYAAEDLGPDHAGWAVPVALAYPLLLIGVAGGVMQWASPRRSAWVLAACGACALLPALLLWIVHH